MAAATIADAGVAGDPASATLAGRWEIDPRQPLPAFDRASAQAFACRDRQDPERRLMALVCTTGLPFRAEAAHFLKETTIPGLATLLDFGTINWPAQQACCVALIYERPVTVLASPAQHFASGGEREPWQVLLRPWVRALHVLAAMDIAHRGIRPDNLWCFSPPGGEILLGDALSGPAGYDQPAAFETIGRAMAEPVGRGEGTTADDIFALGVTLLAFVTGSEPASCRDDEDLLGARIDRGSYAAFTEGLRVPLPLVEPLRGMLADTAAERWNIGDLQVWLQGGRPTPKMVRPTQTPGAPFVFAGKPHSGLRSLARSLIGNVAEAANIIRSGALEHWLRRNRHDPMQRKRLAEFAAGAGRNSGESSGHADDALVARVALLLDPDAPIRYRGISFAADGVGPAIARRFLDGENTQAIAEAIALDLPAAHQLRRTEKTAETMPSFGIWVRYLRDPRPGFGIERCLYEACCGQACLSPPLRRYCVTDLAALLPALDALAATGTGGARPLDRHVAAFIAARAGATAAALLPPLAEDEPAATTAALGLLAYVQTSHPGAPVPHLAGWIGRTLPPVLATFRHRAGRAALERDVRREIAGGDLRRLFAVVGDPERWRRDREGFLAAKATWERAETEIARLQAGEPLRKRASEIRGGRIAAVLAVTIATGSFCLSLALAFH